MIIQSAKATLNPYPTITAPLLTSGTHRRNKHEKQPSALEECWFRGGKPWVHGAQEQFSSWETPIRSQAFRVVVTLLNENNLPLLAREHKHFFRLTNTGVDLETDMIYHRWETDLYGCTIPMAWWQSVRDATIYASSWVWFLLFPPQNHCFLSRKRGIVTRLSNPSFGLGSSCWLQRLGKEAGRWHPCHVNAC